MAPGAERKQLGPFVLDQELGTGGMSRVWSGQARGNAYAIKVLEVAPEVDAEWARAAFVAEVRALAGLCHPGVVEVVDADLGASHPWYAMPVLGAHLGRWRGRLTPPEVHGVAVQVLSALAHVHARGWVHRDIKPQNLLLHGTQFEGPVVLADFGVALPVEEQRDTQLLIGTPQYMAPEQILGSQRDIGPASDLYALGCTLHALAVGPPPFGGKVDPAITGHLTASPPQLPSAFADLQPWFDRVLAKRWQDRFPSAAAALSALPPLGRGDWQPQPPATLEDTPTVVVETDGERTEVRGSGDGPRPLPARPPTRRPHHAPLGVGIVGLRPLAHSLEDPVGRSLWEALRSVADSGRVQVTLLKGPGRERLLRWLTESASEVSGTPSFWTRHHAELGGGDGLGATVCRALGCEGLDAEQARARVEEHWGPDAGPWVDLFAGPDVARLADPYRRFSALVDWLGHASRGARAAVWVLSDLQWGLEAIALCEHLAERQDVPVLVVGTLDADALTDRPAERRALEALEQRAGVQVLTTEPASARKVRAALRAQVELHRHLETVVVEAADGDPALAMEQVRQWVDEGVLVQGPEGAVLARPVGVAGSAGELYRRQVDRVLAEWSDAEAQAAEVAATLGVTVDLSEWRLACAALGQVATPVVLARLQRLGWIRVGAAQAGFDFMSARFREALRQRALELGRSRAQHQACAVALQDRPEADAQRRRGRHQLAAGRSAEGATTLLSAAAGLARAGRLDEARELLEMREAALSTEDGTARRAGWELSLSVAMEARQLERVRAIAPRLEQAGRLHGDARAVAVAQLASARVRWWGPGDAAGAAAQLQGAVTLAQRAGDAALAASCRAHLGWMLLRQGRWSDAEAELERARATAVREGAARTEAEALWGLGDVLRRQGRHREALPWLEQAEERYVQQGALTMAATLRNTLGEVARAGGAPSRAREHYRSSRAQARLLGSPNWVFPAYNLAVMELRAGNLAAAQKGLDELWEATERPSHAWLRGTLYLTQAYAHALAERWEDCLEALEAGVALVDRARGVDADLLALVEAATDLAPEPWRASLARLAAYLARSAG